MTSTEPYDASGQSNLPWIRPYESKRDFNAVIQAFRETADAALQSEPSWTYAEYLWIRPYLLLAPESCFVLDDGYGTAVGYIVGTPSTADFAQRWQHEFVSTIDQSQVPKPASDYHPTWDGDRPGKLLRLIYFDQVELLNGQWPKLWEAYPAHLHIDIRHKWTGQGHGPRLVAAFMKHLHGQGSSGVHLGMVPTNSRAGEFYDRLGFKRYPEVMDEGKSGELGRIEGSIILVKSVPNQPNP